MNNPPASESAKSTSVRGNYLLKRRNFIYLLIVVVVAFGSKDYIINSLINVDKDHKEIVRVLADQNMLSQRITKLALLIQNDFEKDTIAGSRPDSLSRLIPRWVSNHNWLLKNNLPHGNNDHIAVLVTDQIRESSEYIDIISQAGLDVLRYRKSDKKKLDQAVSKIDRYELPYHALVEKSLNLYKAQMAEEHRFLTKLQYILSIIAILVLVTGFVVLIIPIFNKLIKEISLRKEVEVNLTKAVQNYLVSETILNRNKKELEEINEAINRSALVTITDTDGIILKANQLFCEVTGYQEAELVGKDHKILSSHYHNQKFWKEFWQSITAGKSWKGEVKNLRKDGKEIWLDTVINPIMGVGGVIRQYLAIRFDITDRKIAESLAEQLNYELRAISNAILPVGIISTDPAGKIVLFSKGAEALLGYESHEMVGETPMAFHDHDEVMQRNAELVLELKRPISGFETFVTIPELEGFESRQWTYIHKSGRRFPVKLVVSPIRNAAGVTTGYVGISIDISDQIMAEEAMRYAKEQAEEANRSKSQFLANMSHEIRTPLNSILGFSELLSESVREEKQRTQLSNIITSGRILLTLINDLLDIAKIESGKVELEYRETDLKKLAEEVSMMFIPETKKHNINLSVEVHNGFPASVLTDDIRIRQILINLIGNAVKFTHRGFIRIYLESQYAVNDPERADVVIKVQDSGIGIDKKHHQRIFEAFQQVLDTTTSQYGGTGLGLSISQKLVGLMGGIITLESKPGEGSTFTIHLPSLMVAQKKRTETIKPEVSGKQKFCKDKTILIVDDVENNINLILDFLEPFPCKKLIARGGAEAVVIARQNNPDLILMDLKMPGTDGWEATRQIRQIESLKGVQVIACTANVVGIKKDDDLFDSFIFKPFRKAQLLEVLENALSTEQGSSDAEITESPFLHEREKIDPSVLANLIAQFGTKLQLAVNNFDVAELEQLFNDLEEFIRLNKLEVLADYVRTAKVDFENFDLDALSESLKQLNKVLGVQ